MVVGGVPLCKHYVVVGNLLDFKKGVRIEYLFLLKNSTSETLLKFVCFCRRIIVKKILYAYQVHSNYCKKIEWWCFFSLAMYRILLELRISRYVIFLGDAKVAQ